MRDLYSNIKTVLALSPAVQAATINGNGIDTYGFNRAAFAVTTGAIVGSGVFALTVQESDDNSTFTDVAAASIDGTLPTSMAADTVYKVGCRGFKRYVRIVVTKTSGTSIAAGAVAILGQPNTRPVA